ncbi:unnamed protein product [Closterium sp. NIES-53]
MGTWWSPRATSTTFGSRAVRNLGKPVELAARYFKEGADEVAFLNITGFRDFPLGDLPMLEVIGDSPTRQRLHLLPFPMFSPSFISPTSPCNPPQVMKRASERVFVPLTVGGGIRDFTDANGSIGTPTGGSQWEEASEASLTPMAGGQWDRWDGSWVVGLWLCMGGGAMAGGEWSGGRWGGVEWCSQSGSNKTLIECWILVGAGQALQVAAEYFRSGADKVSIGSEAVFAAEELLASGRCCSARHGGESLMPPSLLITGATAALLACSPGRVREWCVTAATCLLAGCLHTFPPGCTSFCPHPSITSSSLCISSAPSFTVDCF